MDWVEAIGYGHEALHTAVLAHLLRGEDAPAVAEALTGIRDVVRVENVATERRLTGRRPIDLAASIVGPGRARTPLGIETKVDSAWSPAQLTETVPPEGLGVLLAVGYTALAATDGDLAALSPKPGWWRLVGPRHWAEIVCQYAADDAELGRYGRRVEQEGLDHDNAREAVVTGHPVVAAEDRHARTLSQWAYFHEVLNRRSDVAAWERKTLVSGPLLTLWVKDFDDGRGDYLEFMGHNDGRCSLNVKTYAPPGAGQIQASRARLSELLAEYRPEAVKRPGGEAKTCTAARWWLEGMTPDQASRFVDTLVTRLEGE